MELRGSVTPERIFMKKYGFIWIILWKIKKIRKPQKMKNPIGKLRPGPPPGKNLHFSDVFDIVCVFANFEPMFWTFKPIGLTPELENILN